VAAPPAPDATERDSAHRLWYELPEDLPATSAGPADPCGEDHPAV